jgi:catechol 2,3-dioxygenase-like lactoylglutathione lyase family enzyme
MSYQFTGIDHIQLAAPKGSEDEARRFFGDILGLPEVPKPANLAKKGGCWFQLGHQQIHVGVQDDFLPAKKAHPAFHVQNIQALRDHLTAQGIATRDEDPLEGAVRFYCDDPFGNRLEFLEWINK